MNHYEDDISLQISNAFGQVLYTTSLQKQAGENITLDWSPSESGMYWIAMRTKEGVQHTLKLIVQ